MSLQQKNNIYRCPVCGYSLFRIENTLKCEKNHSFDFARQGYVNLLLSNTSSHGDGGEMIDARRKFLSSGFYLPLRDKIFELMQKYVKNTAVLDAGCGEGYYTQKLTELEDCDIYGIDISKDGAKKTAVLIRQNGGETCVGSVYNMPYISESFGAVVNIFSPLSLKEYLRVLKNDGVLILAYPLPEHLYEMKKVLYDEVIIKETEDTCLEGFELLDSAELTYKMELSRDDLINLFAMTPYYYNCPKIGAERLKNTEKLDVTASFGVLIYKKIPNS